MYHELSLIVWGYCIRMRVAPAAMSYRRWLVRRRASVAAAWHCHPSYYENPTLHIRVRWGRPFRTLFPLPLYVIARNEAIHLCQIYVRFVSPQKKHPFHSQLLTRQQTTTNDYSRLQTFIQRLSLDKDCIFAAISKCSKLNCILFWLVTFLASRHCEEERRSNPKADCLDCFVPRSDAKRVWQSIM